MTRKTSLLRRSRAWSRLQVCCLVLGVCGLGFAPAAHAQKIQQQPAHPYPYWHHRHPEGPPWKAPVADSASFHIGASKIEVDFAPGPLDLSTQQIMRWVKDAASSVATYYGQFPVPMDRILIEPVPNAEGVLSGTTWGNVSGDPAFTVMRVGQHTTPEDLNRDRRMMQEMVRTAFPTQKWTHHWIEAGLATYIGPVAQLQNGLAPAKKIWSEMVRHMPQGYPPPGDKGLDRTHTRALTYWGGAQFCLLADVSIREETHDRKGLQDALRAIVRAGGTINHKWPIQKALAVGDKATGTHVLEDLYARMADHPVKINLPKLWKELGVVRDGQSVRFDAKAPEASIRRAIDAVPKSGRIAPKGFTPAPVTGAHVKFVTQPEKHR